MSKKSSTFALAFEKEATGCSSARLECLLWEQEVVSSNLAIPTNRRKRDSVLSLFFVSLPIGKSFACLVHICSALFIEVNLRKSGVIE